MTKKLISLLLVLLLCLSLCACASNSSTTDTTTTDKAETTQAATTDKSSDTAAAGGVTLNIMLVNNTATSALAEYAQEYYKADGVTLNISVLPEDDMREKFTTEASTGGSTYDMYYIGPYEVSYWAAYGWIPSMQSQIDSMSADEKTAYDFDDFFQLQLQALQYDGQQYALPFYGESSFLMYNENLFDQAGVAYPTDGISFDQIATDAAAIKALGDDYVGIAYRGQAGWGNSGAIIFTMIYAYGGGYYDMDWNVDFDTQNVRDALTMYKDLLVNYGPQDPTTYSYNEVIALMQQGKCGMVYDATSLALSLEGKDSKIAGKVGYCAVAQNGVKAAWLWNWAFALNQNSSQDKQDAMFDFILWATSKDYVKLCLEQDPTAATCPSGVRQSTYDLDAYKSVPYAAATLAAYDGATFTHTDRPYNGIQYITLPEWSSIGDEIAQQVALYVTGEQDLDAVISDGVSYLQNVKEEGGYGA